MKRAGRTLVNSLREAAHSFARARLRTVLGLIGIAIGIASVIAMVSASEIAKTEARKQFEALGTDIITVQVGSGYRGGTSGSTTRWRWRGRCRRSPRRRRRFGSAAASSMPGGGSAGVP